MSGISGGSGRKGDGFGPIVLGEFRSKVGWEGGSLRWSRSGELLYGTDVVIRGLRRGTRSRVSFEVEGRAKMRDVVLWVLACKP